MSRRFVRDYEILKCANMIYRIVRLATPKGKLIDPKKTYTLTISGEELLGFLLKAKKLYRHERRLQEMMRG